MAMKSEEAGKKLSKDSMKTIQEVETKIDRMINLHYAGTDKIEMKIKYKCLLTINEILELEKRYKEVGWKKLTYKSLQYAGTHANEYAFTLYV